MAEETAPLVAKETEAICVMATKTEAPATLEAAVTSRVSKRASVLVAVPSAAGSMLTDMVSANWTGGCGGGGKGGGGEGGGDRGGGGEGGGGIGGAGEGGGGEVGSGGEGERFGGGQDGGAAGGGGLSGRGVSSRLGSTVTSAWTVSGKWSLSRAPKLTEADAATCSHDRDSVGLATDRATRALVCGAET